MALHIYNNPWDFVIVYLWQLIVTSVTTHNCDMAHLWHYSHDNPIVTSVTIIIVALHICDKPQWYWTHIATHCGIAHAWQPMVTYVTTLCNVAHLGQAIVTVALHILREEIWKLYIALVWCCDTITLPLEGKCWSNYGDDVIDNSKITITILMVYGIHWL